MKKILLAFLFTAATTVAMPYTEKADDHKEAVTDYIQHPPRPVPPPRPPAPPSRAQIKAKRDADVKAAKRGIKKAASKTRKALRLPPPPPPPPRPPRR